MRRSASALLVSLTAVAVLTSTPGAIAAEDRCKLDPIDGQIVCIVDGGDSTPEQPGVRIADPEDPGKRYVYTTTDAAIGDCYYWSNVPGGLDAWDPVNDAAVIAIATGLPLCPAVIVPPVDPETTAWAIFRSWDLDVPEPAITPTDRGITGIATHVGVTTPAAITYSEVLPDGRLLEVRARATTLVVDWGDGVITTHDPTTATGYPNGSAAHVYQLKTCTQQYRAEHPSGGLCHPTAEYYPIVASFVWSGEFNIGSGWQVLGILTVSGEPTNYDVDEARGITTP